MSIKGKIAIVTGASRGIGKAIALALGAHGAKVVVNYVSSEDRANEVVESIIALGSEAISIKGDVSNSEAVKAMFARVKEEFGMVEIVVNNAGIIKHAPLAFIADKDWNDVIDINLKGAFNCTKLAVRDFMKTRWGRVINISSDAGRLGEVMGAHYSASKAGLLGLTKSTARELAIYGVTVNAISPGYIETEMTISSDKAKKEKQINMVPVGRYGNAKEVAELAMHLISENGSYITGQTISIDGGLFM